MSSLKSIALGAIACCRLKASSCRVRELPRSTSRSSSFREARVFGSSEASSWIRPRCIRTAARMLLKSWATPPASWPMASIFCA